MDQGTRVERLPGFLALKRQGGGSLGTNGEKALVWEGKKQKSKAVATGTLSRLAAWGSRHSS